MTFKATWEEGNYWVFVLAKYDCYPEIDGWDVNEFGLDIHSSESSNMVLSNYFRIWATRPDELKVFNPILWGELAKEFKAYLIKEYNLLAGEECVEYIVEIYREGGSFGVMSIPEEELQKIYFW
jgi:hypothetical protein